MKQEKTKKQAFSLAEALITLLVVCLITLASIPILTKKKRVSDSSVHGKWICTLNSRNQHVFWSSKTSGGDINNADTWNLSNNGNSCVFIPPMNARNFAVSLSGGGGGGAGVQVTEGGSATWYNDFAVKVPGYYDILAVGAGGTGGGTTDNKGKSNSGGQGAAIAMRVFLDDTVERLELEKGTVQTGENGENNNGKAGKASVVMVYGKDKNTGISYVDTLVSAGGGAGGKGGKHGDDSVTQSRTATSPGKGTVSSSNRFQFDYTCYGKSGTSTSCHIYQNMYGGFSRDSHSGADTRCNTGYLNKYSQRLLNQFFTVRKNSIPAIFPEIDCNKYSKAFDMTYDDNELSLSEKSIRDQFCAMPGIGGGARESNSPCTAGGGSKKGGRTGTDGLIMVSTKYIQTGKGGEAGEVSKNLFYPKFETQKITIYIGAGGKGSETGNGENGGTTRIIGNNLSIMPVSGGAGGKMNSEPSAAFVSVAGGNGEKSRLFFDKEPNLPLGGLNYEDPDNKTGQYNASADGIKSSVGYGSGGGAGGVMVDNNSNTTKGKGADGAPGAVIIEW